MSENPNGSSYWNFTYWLLFGFWCLVFGFSLLYFLSSEDRNNHTAGIDKTNRFEQINGVIHLQTSVSGGTRTIDNYVKLAREYGMGILIITDHDTLSYEYAIYPLRWLVRKKVEKESALTYGMDKYLNLFERCPRAYPDILIIDGVESTPFYYWSGSYKTKHRGRLSWRELTLHNRGKHILVIGLNKPQAYEQLPLIANGYSRYDAYHGDAGDKPYQDLIDYVNSKGGLTFWAHPEAKEKKMIGGVAIHTPPYYDSLLNTVNYTGFAVYAEGYQKVGRIGGIWDKALKEYCQGKRKSPVWAIGELDDYGKKQIDSVQTVFLLKEKSYDGVITALKTGKIYALTKPSRARALLRLEHFTVEDSNNPEKVGYSGDEIICQGKPIIRIKLMHKPALSSARVTVKLIRAGKLIKEYNEPLPFETTFTDNNVKSGEKTYYRLDITDEFGGKLISNPIFIIYIDFLSHLSPLPLGGDPPDRPPERCQSGRDGQGLGEGDFP